MRKTAIIILFITIVIFFGQKMLTAQKNSHFSAALRLVEMTFNKEAVYQQFIYFGLLPNKERFENNPKTKKYSEILLGVVKEVLDEYFNDPETQKNLKLIYANIYMEEFTEKELREMIEFYKTDTGKKVLQKLPSILEKGRRKEAEVASGLSSPKYEKMLSNRLNELQKKGLLPKEF